LYYPERVKDLFYLKPIQCPQFWVVIFVLLFNACATLPEPSHDTFHFPKDKAFIEIPKRRYTVLGQVRSKVDYSSIDFKHWDDESHGSSKLCVNYYNKAAKDLVRRAEDKGADAVIKVRSVVFFEDGRREEFPSPECAEDGEEGQVLLQGIAVKWVPQKEQTAENGWLKGDPGAGSEAKRTF